MSWPMVAIKDCCTVIGGATPKREVEEYWDNNDVPWITPKDISKINGMYLDDAPEYISNKGFKSCAAHKLPAGSLLLTSRAPIGNVAISNKEMATNQGFKSLIPSERVDVKYLYFCMLFSAKRLDNAGNGATFKEVSKKIVEEFKIPLPLLETQKQIATVLEKSDQLRKDCQLMEQELNSLAQSVFIDMFGDPVTNPKGWEKGQLGQEAELLAGFAFKSKEYSKNPEHVKLCRGINIFPGKTSWSNAEYWDYKNEPSLKKYELEENDIVIAMDRPWVSGGFKIATLKKSDLPSLLLQRVMRVRGKTQEKAKFLYHALRQPAFLNHSNMTETTVPHISPKDVSSYKIPVPSPQELSKFYELTNRINENIRFTLSKAIESESIFNSLMQKAFKGELNLSKQAV